MNGELSLVPNEEKYWDFILKLRNNSDVKKGFIQQEHIQIGDHLDHMAEYGGCYYICLLDSTPVGYTGVINNDIRVATSPCYQGKGIGKFMINTLATRFPKAFAKVKIDNISSLRLFESCGFVKKYYILEKQ